jgi:hypothetical protein
MPDDSVVCMHRIQCHNQRCKSMKNYGVPACEALQAGSFLHKITGVINFNY